MLGIALPALSCWKNPLKWVLFPPYRRGNGLRDDKQHALGHRTRALAMPQCTMLKLLFPPQHTLSLQNVRLGMKLGKPLYFPGIQLPQLQHEESQTK